MSDIEIPQELKSAVKFNNNKLYVIANYRAHSLFLSLESRLKKQIENLTVEIVPAEDIIKIESGLLALKDNSLTDERIINTYKKIFESAASVSASDIHILKFNELYTDIFFRTDGKLSKYSQATYQEGEQIMRSIYQNISMSDVSYIENSYQAGQIHSFDRAGLLPESVSSIRIQRGPMMNGHYMVLRLLYKENSNKVHVNAAKIGQILLDKKLITQEVLNESLKIQKERKLKGKYIKLGDILLQNNFITQRELEEALFVQKGSLSLGVEMFTHYGYTASQAQVLAKAARQPQGLVIFSGPTGAGKSTALKTALEFQSILYPEKAIFTIEDPPEYNIRGSRQLPVLNANTDDKRESKFAEGLRVAMRSDPDILMVGEIRDAPTAQVAIDAVITGHQMWTTIHAIDVFAILQRLIRFGVNADDLYDEKLLNVLVGQRLLPKLCDNCKTDYNPGMLDDDLNALLEPIKEHIKLKNISGCEKCNFSGSSGRVVVAEVLDITDTLLNDIKNEGIQSVRREFEKRGFTITKHAVQRMLKGEVDPKDVIAYVGDIRKDILEVIFNEFSESFI